MVTNEIIYFERPGPHNTHEVIEAVKRRCKEIAISYIVVASNSGTTALALWEAMRDSDVKIISVSGHAGWSGGDEPSMSQEKKDELGANGVKVLTASHVLSGVARSISNKFGGVSHVEIIAHTLRLLGQGMKVAVEISVMAADAGLIPTDAEIIAIGGSGKGADFAAVIKAAHMNNFFDLEIREIIAMPRKK